MRNEDTQPQALSEPLGIWTDAENQEIIVISLDTLNLVYLPEQFPQSIGRQEGCNEPTRTGDATVSKGSKLGDALRHRGRCLLLVEDRSLLRYCPGIDAIADEEWNAVLRHVDLIGLDDQDVPDSLMQNDVVGGLNAVLGDEFDARKRREVSDHSIEHRFGVRRDRG